MGNGYILLKKCLFVNSHLHPVAMHVEPLKNSNSEGKVRTLGIKQPVHVIFRFPVECFSFSFPKTCRTTPPAPQADTPVYLLIFL